MRYLLRSAALVCGALLMMGGSGSAHAKGHVWECTIRQSVPVTVHARVEDARNAMWAATQAARNGTGPKPAVPNFTFDETDGVARWGRYKVAHRIHVKDPGKPILASAHGGDWYLEIHRETRGTPFTWHASGVYLIGRCQ